MAEDETRINIEEGAELDDDAIDEIAGGRVYFTGEGYEVIDEKGNVIVTFWGTDADVHQRAQGYARELGLSARDISWFSLDALRRHNSQVAQPLE